MGTSATQEDKTGETWKMNVTADNCWEDLILTLGMYVSLRLQLAPSQQSALSTYGQTVSPLPQLVKPEIRTSSPTKTSYLEW